MDRHILIHPFDGPPELVDDTSGPYDPMAYLLLFPSGEKWCRKNQSQIHGDLLSGLRDAYVAGETDSGNVGARTFLPSSFLGGPHDMHQQFQDAMAVVQRNEKPDYFVSMI